MLCRSTLLVFGGERLGELGESLGRLDRLVAERALSVDALGQLVALLLHLLVEVGDLLVEQLYCVLLVRDLCNNNKYQFKTTTNQVQ